MTTNELREAAQRALSIAKGKIESALDCHPQAVRPLLGEAWDAINEAAGSLASSAATNEAAGQWISTGERLPPLGTLVLGWTAGGSLSVFARDDGGGEGWLWARQTRCFDIADPDGIEADDDYSVKFWMPLPAAPGSSAASPAPASQAKGRVQIVGDTRFEGWLAESAKGGKLFMYGKHDMRDAYWAGYQEACGPTEGPFATVDEAMAALAAQPAQPLPQQAEAVAWRYRPSAQWSGALFTDDPALVALARDVQVEITPLYEHPAPAVDRGLSEADDVWTAEQLDGIASAVKDSCGPATAWRVRKLLSTAQAVPKAHESEVFEDWAKRCRFHFPHFDRFPASDENWPRQYKNVQIQAAWEAWQARAALSTTSPVAPEPTSPPYSPHRPSREWYAEMVKSEPEDLPGALAAGALATPAEPVAPGGLPSGYIAALSSLADEIDVEEVCGHDVAAHLRAMIAAAPPAPASEAPREVVLPTQAAQDVLAERQRQLSVEGWTPEHDDEHSHGEMALAASCYCEEGPDPYGHTYPAIPLRWPWASDWWKPNGYRRNLVKAGALILAEIERLDRAYGKQCAEAAKGTKA